MASSNGNTTIIVLGAVAIVAIIASAFVIVNLTGGEGGTDDKGAGTDTTPANPNIVKDASFTVSIGEIKNMGPPNDFQYREVTATPKYADGVVEHVWLYSFDDVNHGTPQTTESLNTGVHTILLPHMSIIHWATYADGETVQSQWSFSDDYLP
ncbi:MAG: hypothetical protein FWH47_08125 [Methanomassiliicoccaceae archaeon]|nr:hypothetical protein [Methanomassiliicoccaceae archaeon]